jgi:hypothetical protein
MKIHNTCLQFGLWLAVCLPLPSYAGMDVPYWLYPEWLAAKVMDFHARNTERYEQAQIVAQAKNGTNSNASSGTVLNANSNMSVTTATVGTTATTMNNELSVRKTALAPVETATAKVNEKHLTKEELIELRKQLRQK